MLQKQTGITTVHYSDCAANTTFFILGNILNYIRNRIFQRVPFCSC